MVKSKEWNWEKVDDNIWNTPSEDIYYYLNIWKEKGFKHFLDLGCGLGRHSILFAENSFNTYSFDLSKAGLKILKEKSEEKNLDIDIKLGDINNLPYESNSFDCMLAYHVISHTDTKGIVNILNEIKRVLKKDGEFFITFCSKNSPSFAKKGYPKIDENTIVKTEEPEKGIPHFYSDINTVKELLQNFKIIRIRHIEDIFENSNSWHYFVHGKKI